MLINDQGELEEQDLGMFHVLLALFNCCHHQNLCNFTC